VSAQQQRQQQQSDFVLTGRRRWYALILRGVVAVAAGITAFTISPTVGKALLVGYLIIDALLAVMLAFTLTMPRRSRLLFGADGIVDAIVAVALIVWAPTTATLVIIVSNWAIATGVLEIGAAILMPKVQGLAWMIGAAGLLSCVAGIAALDWTDLSIVGVLYVFAAYALVAGGLFLTFGITLLRAVLAAERARKRERSLP
jgi:uncharacterized membrane protein HdeD (DUF308 family)